PIIYFPSSNAPYSHDIDTVSLHDALPISSERKISPEALVKSEIASATWLLVGCLLPAAMALLCGISRVLLSRFRIEAPSRQATRDRKSTRLNSSHVKISYAVFCLKKKKIY